MMCPDTAFNTRLKRFIPVEYGRDKYKFALPPIDFENPASIVVRQVKASDDLNGNDSSKINGDDSGQKWISIPPPRQDLEACKSLELWDENRGLAIQTRVVEKQEITCPGEVKLQVFSNERLPDNTTLMLHFLKRGQLTTRTLKLQPDYTCTSADNSSEDVHELKVELSGPEIVDDSLRSYLAADGRFIGRVLSNLDSLVEVLTGCAKQNLVKFTANVHVLKYLLSHQNASKLRQDSLDRKAAGYIISDFGNEVRFQHPSIGAFSTFGPRFGGNGSIWLIAYVFKKFTFLGRCFIDRDNEFTSFAENANSAEFKLHLTSHVLTALSSAGTTLKEARAA
ncbi:unnamed protein product [Hymenolepis diminuta]|uniref:Alpha-macroglobulin-like TED domain-containing protein n=1 Tax=Hymenolepis diminuta TaxID=6216 RepID=A0A3P7BTA5_HYMDI|nr:unnamed protein product [Hymenolepis diminuta]